MNKRVFNLFIVLLLFLFLVSAVSAGDIQDDNMTILSSGDDYHAISSNLSNDEIQTKFDNAKDGDTFEFTDKEYNGISLVVNKKLNIISKNDSVVYASSQITDNARSLGIDKTFGFYFTSKATGSVLSGITIVASNCDYGVVVDSSKNVKISDNRITNGENGVLIKDSDSITLYGNDISKARGSGIRLQDAKNCLLKSNEISYNKLSGIETSNIYYCNITNNTIHHNDLNGISTFNRSSHTLINDNTVYENTNGVYINSTSTYDVVKTNSLTYSRKDPRSSMGGFETGNGFLLGSGFKSSGNSILDVSYNYLAHNEFYQAKNYWENENYELGQNWYDSNDPSNTFVCPRLLASLMKLDTLSISNTLTLQLKDSSGKAVNEFATFQTNVEVDGNKYTVTVKNGQASVVKDLDPTVDHDVQVEIGGQYYKYDYKASGEKGESQDSKTSQTDGESGSQNNNGDDGTSDVNGNSNYQGNSQGGNSSGSHVTNSKNSGNYGSNSSDISSQDTSDNGEDALSNGDFDAGDSGSGEASREGKAYEIVPPVTTSKELTNTSGLIVLCILSIMGCLIYGYRRNSKFDD